MKDMLMTAATVLKSLDDVRHIAHLFDVRTTPEADKHARLHDMHTNRQEAAKQCGCQQCQDILNAPHEPRDISPLQAVGVVVAAGLVGFGIVKMFQEK